MDELDKNILIELQKEGRLSNEQLAKRVNLTASPCLRRIRALEKNQVIVGYAAQVDQKKVGLDVTAFIHIKLERHSEQSINEFEQAVKDIPEILECYLMTGDWDYLLRIATKNLDTYEQFVRHKVHRIPWVASMDSRFAYGAVKRTAVYPL